MLLCGHPTVCTSVHLPSFCLSIRLSVCHPVCLSLPPSILSSIHPFCLFGRPWSLVYTVLCLKFWMESFHIWHRWSVALDGVLSVIICNLDKYHQCHLAMISQQMLLRYCTSTLVCSVTYTLDWMLEYLAPMITSMRGCLADNNLLK